MMRKLKLFIRDETGQTTTEYILILAVAVMIAMKFKGAIGDKIKNIADGLGGKIENTINEIE